MEKTTVCYIKRKGFNDEYLFMYRNKKLNDVNHGKFIGIGGHVEKNETHDECNIREVYEETGLELLDSDYLGVVHYFDDEFCMDMYVYVSDNYLGSDLLPDCDEGELNWLSIEKFYKSPHFKGDEYFLEFVFNKIFFGEITLIYSDGILSKIIHNGKIVLP